MKFYRIFPKAVAFLGLTRTPVVMGTGADLGVGDNVAPLLEPMDVTDVIDSASLESMINAAQVLDQGTAAYTDIEVEKSIGAAVPSQMVSSLLPMMNEEAASSIADGAESDAEADHILYDELIPSCSPFPVKRFQDGTCKSKKKKGKKGKKDKAGTNRYAWGADTYDDGRGTVVSVMIHSGGTPAALSATPTRPTITLRDKDAEIIAKVLLEDKYVGLRSALVWKVHKDEYNAIQKVEVLAGDIVPGGQASLYKFTIYINRMNSSGSGSGMPKPKEEEEDMDHDDETRRRLKRSRSKSMKSSSKCDKFKVKREVLLGPDAPTGILVPNGGSSIRSLRRLTSAMCSTSSDERRKRGLEYDEHGPDRVVFAAFNEALGGTTPGEMDLPSLFVYVFDPDYPSDPPRGVNLLSSGNPLVLGLVWDFEIDPYANNVYYNIVRIRFPDASRLGGFDLTPELWAGDRIDLCSGSATEVVQFDDIRSDDIDSNEHDSAAGSMQVLPENKVHYCTLSGFVYQFLASGIRRKLNHLDEIQSEVQEFLRAAELGDPQVCYVCDRDSGECTEPLALPRQNAFSAYIWDQTKCNGKVFAATLDLSGIFSRLIVSLIVALIKELFGIDLEDAGPIVAFILELIGYFILSLLVGEHISKTNGGFNVLYADVSSLTVDVDEHDWKTVTADGFIRVDDNGWEIPGIPGYILANYEGRFMEDGVRNMVCINDRYVAIGTAVYGDEPSTTYILDTHGRKYCPGDRTDDRSFPED